MSDFDTNQTVILSYRSQYLLSELALSCFDKDSNFGSPFLHQEREETTRSHLVSAWTDSCLMREPFIFISLSYCTLRSSFLFIPGCSAWKPFARLFPIKTQEVTSLPCGSDWTWSSFPEIVVRTPLTYYEMNISKSLFATFRWVFIPN